MTTYAQVIDNRAYNVFIGDDLNSALSGKVNPEWAQNEIANGRNWSVVPDGTIHGAISNGDGTYINPIVPAPDFRTLTGSQFLAMLVKALGFARAEQLLKANAVIEALLMKAIAIDRYLGNTPTAIAYLQNMQNNPLTNTELSAIETEWRAL